MQNSNLALNIFPSLRENWLLFINKVSDELQNMITTYNSDRSKVRAYEHIVNSIKEIENLSKSNVAEILNHRNIFKFIDNSNELMESFDALELFVKRNNTDNPAVKKIYTRIVTSPKILETNSEYDRLSIKVQFDKERIKRIRELVRGSKIDYTLIKELVNKFDFNAEQKKNILFYPVVMLAIRQNDLKNSKENEIKQKQEKEKFYHDRFNELCINYEKKKASLNNLLVKCFNVRENMSRSDIDMYSGFINNTYEIGEYEFSDDNLFKIYTLAFFKIKKDIENFIDGISDLIVDGQDLDDELVFFQEMINEFDTIATKLKSLLKVEEEIPDKLENNMFFALDAFNRLTISDELLKDKNKSNIRALLQKSNSISNSKIDGVKTNHMLGVEEAEKLLGMNISIMITSKTILAYVVIDKNILIIAGEPNNTSKFDRVVNRNVEHNIVSIKKQIALIKENNVDYIELQNRIIQSILEEEEKQKAM